MRNVVLALWCLGVFALLYGVSLVLLIQHVSSPLSAFAEGSIMCLGIVGSIFIMRYGKKV